MKIQSHAYSFECDAVVYYSTKDAVGTAVSNMKDVFGMTVSSGFDKGAPIAMRSIATMIVTFNYCGDASREEVRLQVDTIVRLILEQSR